MLFNYVNYLPRKLKKRQNVGWSHCLTLPFTFSSQAVNQSTQTGNYNNLMRFYSRTFETYGDICGTFKAVRDQSDLSEYGFSDLMEDPELNMELIYSVNDALRNSVTNIKFP